MKNKDIDEVVFKFALNDKWQEIKKQLLQEIDSTQSLIRLIDEKVKELENEKSKKN